MFHRYVKKGSVETKNRLSKFMLKVELEPVRSALVFFSLYDCPVLSDCVTLPSRNH